MPLSEFSVAPQRRHSVDHRTFDMWMFVDRTLISRVMLAAFTHLLGRSQVIHQAAFPASHSWHTISLASHYTTARTNCHPAEKRRVIWLANAAVERHRGDFRGCHKGETAQTTLNADLAVFCDLSPQKERVVSGKRPGLRGSCL